MQYEEMWNTLIYHVKLRECVLILSDEYNATALHIYQPKILYVPLMVFFEKPIEFLNYIYTEKICEGKYSSYALSDISFFSTHITIAQELYNLKFQTVPNYYGGCDYILEFKK